VLIGVTSGLVHSNFAEQVLKVLTFSWLTAFFSRFSHVNFAEQVLKARTFLRLFGKGKEEGKNTKKSDSEAVEAFYKDIFGLELVLDQGWIRAYSTDSEIATRVVITPETGSCAPVSDLSIKVDNLATVLQRVKSAELAIKYGQETDPCGIQGFYFRDPFGKLVNVFQCKNKAAGKPGK